MEPKTLNVFLFKFVPECDRFPEFIFGGWSDQTHSKAVPFSRILITDRILTINTGPHSYTAERYPLLSTLRMHQRQKYFTDSSIA